MRLVLVLLNVITTTYSMTLLVDLNVRTIEYNNGYSVGGVSTRSTLNTNYDEDPYVCNSHVYAHFKGISDMRWVSPLPELSTMKSTRACPFIGELDLELTGFYHPFYHSPLGIRFCRKCLSYSFFETVIL